MSEAGERGKGNGEACEDGQEVMRGSSARDPTLTRKTQMHRFLIVAAPLLWHPSPPPPLSGSQVMALIQLGALCTTEEVVNAITIT